MYFRVSLYYLQFVHNLGFLRLSFARRGALRHLGGAAFPKKIG